MNKSISKDVEQQIIELYGAGVTVSQIMEQTGVSNSTVTRVAREAIMRYKLEPRRANFGKPRPSKGEGKGYHYEKRGYACGSRKLTEEQQKEIVKDYKNGMTYTEMMEKYGVWQKTLKSVIDRAIEKGVCLPRGRGNGKRSKTE